MKTNIYICVLVLLLSSCGISKEEHSMVVDANTSLQQQCDSMGQVIAQQKNTISELRDSLIIYSYPADSRLFKISELIESDKLDEALKEISELRRYFPNSQEASKSDALVERITQRRVVLDAERERVKAMGFKLLKDNAVVKTDMGTARFGSFRFGRTFVFDRVLDVDEYHYRTADKDDVYILVSMSFTSKEKYVTTPSLNAYLIKDGKLEYLSFFIQEYDYYNTYGAYIGNYSEDSHDFSKVSTVRYELAATISKEDSKKTIVIMVDEDKNKNKELTPEYVINNCKVVKVLNRHKL